jgi:hypothetical protein
MILQIHDILRPDGHVEGHIAETLRHTEERAARCGEDGNRHAGTYADRHAASELGCYPPN